jgi:hypothetical protein
LRYRGEGSIPTKDLGRIKGSKDVEVLDQTSRMLLVVAPKEELDRVVRTDGEWIVIPERTMSLPDPSPKLKKKA